MPYRPQVVRIRSGRDFDPLVTQDRVQATNDAGQLVLGAHHRADVLVGAGSLFEEASLEAVVVPEAADLSAELARGDGLASGAPTEGPAGAVGARAERTGGTAALDVEARRIPSSPDDAGLSGAGGDRSLAVDPELLAVMDLAAHVVVVAGDQGRGVDAEAERGLHDLGGGLDHSAAAGVGVGDGRLHVTEIRRALRGIGAQVAQPGPGGWSVLEVMIEDRSPQGPRAAVEHLHNIPASSRCSSRKWLPRPRVANWTRLSRRRTRSRRGSLRGRASRGGGSSSRSVARP